MRLFVAGRPLANLILEPPTLIVGVVELTEAVGQLPSSDEELEPLGQIRVGAMLLGQR